MDPNIIIIIIAIILLIIYTIIVTMMYIGKWGFFTPYKQELLPNAFRPIDLKIQGPTMPAESMLQLQAHNNNPNLLVNAYF